MTPMTSTRFVEWVRFFDNERLIASDLQAIDDFARQMRWLHNRSLHQPGVASGYAVAGEKGDRQVIVQPGYALDALGREIVLTQTWTQPVPPEAGDGRGGPAIYDLTVAYPTMLPESQTRTADCASAVPGAVRLQELPVFCWVAVFKNDLLREEIERGERIVLARAEIRNCQLSRRISLEQRTAARPGVHPFVYAATAAPAWVVTDQALGIEIAPAAAISPAPGTIRTIPIDTSGAGFRTTPCYFANLADDPTILLNGRIVRLDVFVSIAYPTTTGFEVSLLIPTLLLFAGGLSRDAVKTALGTPTWKLEWMGVEA